MAISTRDLTELPAPPRLEELSRSLAALEIIMSPDWHYRYFHYDPAWDPKSTERLAKLDTGSGDNYFLLFAPHGVFLKGFDHESPMTPWAHDPLRVWPGVLNEVPKEFEACLNEPAFDMESTTFCIWRLVSDHEWKRGNIDFPDGDDPDGSKDLLGMLDDNPDTYVRFAAEYYERDIPVEGVRRAYSGHSITRELAAGLNPNADWEPAAAELRQIGFPVTTTA